VYVDVVDACAPQRPAHFAWKAIGGVAERVLSMTTRIERRTMRTSIRARLTIIIALSSAIAGGNGSPAGAQATTLQSPFLFTTLPPIARSHITAAIDAGYNARAFEPVAGERMESRASVLATLSSLIAVQGQVGGASTLDHRTRLAGQVEMMVTPLRRGGYSLGTDVGLRREYTGTTVALARMVGARTTSHSALAADVLLEHPYSADRDGVDIITTVGATRALMSNVWLGVEAVGSDLEGLWDSEEAEGGATVLVGPTLAVAVSDRWRLVLGGGPVLRATTSRTRVEVPYVQSPLFLGSRTGYVIRTSLRLAW
jgi:hypothetical protein